MSVATWILATRCVGGAHLAIAVGNLVLARALDCRARLRTVDPWLGQVFIVHAGYLIAVLAWIGVVCLAFPGELAATSFGRFICATLVAFWGMRLALHAWYFDRALLRRLRLASWAFVIAVSAFVALFAALAAGAAA